MTLTVTVRGVTSSDRRARRTTMRMLRQRVVAGHGEGGSGSSRGRRAERLRSA